MPALINQKYINYINYLFNQIKLKLINNSKFSIYQSFFKSNITTSNFQAIPNIKNIIIDLYIIL